MRVYISLWLIYSLCVLPPFFHMEDIRTNYLLSKKSSRIADLFQNNYHMFGMLLLLPQPILNLPFSICFPKQ